MNVTINISHGYVGDLEIWLRSPAGTEARIFNSRGGSGNNLSSTTFDDEAGTPIGSAGAPFTGTWQPDSPLFVFDGEAATGNWTLRIRDNGWFDDGTLTSWSFSFDLSCP